MPFARPTLAQLIARAKADIEARLPGADANLRYSVESVLAEMASGAVHGLHGHLVWLSRQLFPNTAEAEFIRMWADIFNLTEIAAVKASGSLDITGTDTSVCPSGTLWQTNDDTPVVYEQDASATIASGTATTSVTALLAGADGNQSIGATLTLVSPVAGINSSATVSGTGITGGSDAETDAALLVRLLSAIRTPPKGGGPGDYVNWALAVAGTTRAWQYPNVDSLGTVGVRFVMDNKAGTIIPDAGEVATVQAYVDTVAPVGSAVTVYQVTDAPTAFTISITPDTATIRTAVEAELEDLYLREASPGATMLLSQINEAVSIAPGETDHSVTVPATDVTHTANQMPTVGTITWV